MKKENALLLAFGKPSGGDPEPDGDEGEAGEVSPEETDAFSELKDAMSSGNPSVGAMALKNFIQLCMKGY